MEIIQSNDLWSQLKNYFNLPKDKNELDQIKNTNKFVFFSKSTNVEQIEYTKAKSAVKDNINGAMRKNDNGKALIEVLKYGFTYEETTNANKNNYNTSDSMIYGYIIIRANEGSSIDTDLIDTINILLWTDQSAKDQPKSDADKLTNDYAFYYISKWTKQQEDQYLIIGFECGHIQLKALTETSDGSNKGNITLKHTASIYTQKKSK